MAREPEAIAELRRDLGERLATFRKAADLTQGQLAKTTYCDRSRIAHLERGTARADERFWQAADQTVGAKGSLLKAFHDLQAHKHQHEHQVHEAQLAAMRAKAERFLHPDGSGIGAASLGDVTGTRDLVLDAARSSAILRASVETRGISQFAMADARQRLYRLATDYALTSDLTPTLSELIELRDELHTTLTIRQHHPSDMRDLYMLLGAACVMLSSISHDLSEPHAGMAQATTAETFAELAGHRGLLTWVYCTKAMIASWWGTPGEALQHAQKAHAVGTAGISAIRLAGLQARALAQLGKRAEAIAVLHAAQDQRDKFSEQNDLQELGEVFTFPLPRQHYYNATTHLHLGNWTEVEQETRTVNDLYDTPTMNEAWPVTLTLTRIYQAQARLQKHGPEGAFDALLPVFDIPAMQRLPQTSQALSGLRSELQSKPFAALPVARDLSEAIGSFQSSTMPQ